MTGLTTDSALGIAESVRARTASAAQVLEMFLDRIATYNPALNAIVALRADGARGDARHIDHLVAAGRDLGPLAGVPFTVKDVLATADLPTTCGSRALDGYRVAQDATVVARLRAAGAILVGKTNTPEFAFGVDTVNDLYGRTKNPLGTFTAGGSSGGESSAVAAGLSAFGIGSDFGGSIRWPAQCAALIGLRPSVGRIPGTGQVPAAGEQPFAAPDPSTLQGMVQVVGPLTRTVADAAAVLTVICGADGIDSRTTDAPLRAFSAVRPEQLQIRWATTVAGLDADVEVADAVASAVQLLHRAGVSATPGLPASIDAAASLYSELRSADPLLEIRHVIRGRENLVGRETRALLESTTEVSPEYLAALWEQRARLGAELAEWLHGDRLLALPVAVVAPFDPLVAPERGDAGELSGFELVTPSRVISLFGLPAISVPCGRTVRGAPLSVQLVAPAFREDLVLAAARWIEQAYGEVT